MNSNRKKTAGGGNASFDFEGREVSESSCSSSSKGVRMAGKIFKVIFISIVVVVWGFIFLTVFLRGNDDIIDTPILSEKARSIYNSDKNGFVMYNIYPSVFMTGDGSLQLSTAVYAESAHEFEVGVRIAWTQLRYCKECDALYTPEQLDKQLKEDSKNAKENEFYEPTACLTRHHLVRASLEDRELYYTITDSEGNVYTQANREKRVKNIDLVVFSIKYEYERVSFSGLYFDLENNIINRKDESSGGESTDELSSDELSEKETSKGPAYYFNIYDRQGGNLLFSACIYNDDTYISRTVFEYPDSEYIGNRNS